MKSLTLHEAATRLGVHYMTAYRYVRLGKLPAVKVEGEWRVREDAFDEFATKPVPAKGRADWDRRLRKRLLAGDENGAWTVVEGALASGMEPADIYVKMLAPAMKRVGDEWESGELSVADEHRASAIALRIIGRLGPKFAKRGRSRGQVLLAAAPGERHSLPLSMLGDIIRSAGYEVVDLGADVPAGDLAETAKKMDRLVAVCISATNHAGDAGVRSAVDAAKGATDAPVFVGGASIIGPEHATRLGADGWAEDALGALTLLEEAASRS